MNSAKLTMVDPAEMAQILAHRFRELRLLGVDAENAGRASGYHGGLSAAI